MYQYHEKSIPPISDDFFEPIYRIHSHNTRIASRSSLHIPQIRTNYGKFNLRCLGAKIWNSIEENIKQLNKRLFKRKLKSMILASY